MWWYFKKLAEDSDEVIYGFSIESKSCTGEILIDKRTHERTILKPAEGHDDGEQCAAGEKAYALVREGFPDVRMVAIG